MTEREGAASPCYASTEVMPCTGDMRLANCWLPSLLVLGGVAGVNVFPPSGFALPLCLCLAGGGFDSWSFSHGFSSVTDLRFCWLRSLCAPSTCVLLCCSILVATLHEQCRKKVLPAGCSLAVWLAPLAALRAAPKWQLLLPLTGTSRRLWPSSWFRSTACTILLRELKRSAIEVAVNCRPTGLPCCSTSECFGLPRFTLL